MGGGLLRQLNLYPGIASHGSNRSGKPSMKKIIVVAALLVVVILFYLFDLQHYLTLDFIKSQQQAIDAYYAEHRMLTLAAFFLAYVVITGASLPGAAVLTAGPGVRMSPSTTRCSCPPATRRGGASGTGRSLPPPS